MAYALCRQLRHSRGQSHGHRCGGVEGLGPHHMRTLAPPEAMPCPIGTSHVFGLVCTAVGSPEQEVSAACEVVFSARGAHDVAVVREHVDGVGGRVVPHVGPLAVVVWFEA